MTDAPGTPDAGFLAFAILDALIGLLISRGVLTRAEIDAMLAETADGLSKETRALSQEGAKFIRARMLADK